MVAGEELGERLEAFCGSYAGQMRTKTRDTSQYGYHYVSGLLRMESKRNMANIGRTTGQAEQNIQHFISESPWSGQGLIETLQTDIGAEEAFAESVLIIDESADEKAGEKSAGASRQRNGRLGKVDLCQVGVFATLATPKAHCWVDGELFIPEKWFSDEYADKRKRAGIPQERVFQTKAQLAKKMVMRCRDDGQLPFVAVDMDSFYGRNFALRQQLRVEQIEYYADVPANSRVYLEKPTISTVRKDGKPRKVPKVSGGKRRSVCDLVDHPDAEAAILRLRPSERGYIEDRFVRLLVWTVNGTDVQQEWLLIRVCPSKTTYCFSNAPANTPFETMAKRKSLRYFIERDNQDGKSGFGWDEFQATKFRAWEHQLALTIMAAWFITQTRLDWAAQYQRDPALLLEFEVDVLPTLSISNVRSLLRAALPLPQLSSQQAIDLVVKHVSSQKSGVAKKARIAYDRGDARRIQSAKHRRHRRCA